MKVVLYGATGMIGSGVLRECLRDPEVTEVLSVGRRGTGQGDPKLREIAPADFGDYAMAVSLFKRALGALNGSLALLNAESSMAHAAVRDYREDALPRLFDLREVWLRVIEECRRELRRPIDEES